MTTSARDYLVAELNRLAAEAKSIAEAADPATGLTDEQRQEVAERMEKAGELKARIQGLDDNENLRKQIEDAIVNGKPSEAPAEPKTLGEAFVKSDGYRTLKERGLAGRWTSGPVVYGTKLTDDGLSVEATDLAAGELPLQPQVAPIVPPSEELRLTVAALFGQGTATQNTIVYLEETTTEPGALSSGPYDGSQIPVLTSEGGAKPAAFVDFTKRTVSIEKVAAFMPVADEMIEDEPQLASYINGRLLIFVRQAEEARVLDVLLAAGIGSAVAADVGGTNLFDAIAAGILDVQAAGGLEPDAVLINPTDFWTLAVEKAAGGTGTYFSGGPYVDPARNPWGITAVVTRAVAAGTPLVGAFREGATLWRKGGLTVEASNSHADYFRKDLTALRAEQRLALAVYRPAAFSQVSVT